MAQPSRCLRRNSIAVALAGATLALPQAAEAKIVGTPTATERNRPALNFARAIAHKPSLIRRAAFSIIPPGGIPAAISTTPLAGFPRAGSSFGILSTGDATLADNKNDAPDTGVTDGGPFVRGARDVTILKIKFTRPKGANCLSIRFRFLSEEFPEFKDSEFNDGFIAELDKSTWTAGSNDNPTIVAPRNFATGSNGQRISVNATGINDVTAGRAKGTTYDGATRILRASTPLNSRPTHTLYLSIFDQGDRVYDSAVFLDRMTIAKRSNCESGIVAD